MWKWAAMWSNRSNLGIVVSLCALTFLLIVGCAPLISEEEFLATASDFALAPDLTCDQLKVAFGVPFVQTVDNPGEIGLAYEEARVSTPDGATLRLWYLADPNDRGIVVFSNGAVGDISCYLLITLILRTNDYSVVMYDYRGFGGSTGSPSLTSLYDDLDTVLDWTLARSGASQVTLMGVSVGTIPSAAQAARRPDEVNAIVLDGVISLRIETERFGFLLGGRPDRYFTQFDELLRLEDQVQDVQQPTLVFTYGLDEYATSSHAPEIFAQSSATVTIFAFPFLPHARGPYLRTQSYTETIISFLDSVWVEASPDDGD